MPSRIEDYAIVGDCETCALVGRDGSIDWLCLPRFDGSACFAALLGTSEHGRWLLAPEGAPVAVRRRYRDATLVLETDWETETGLATVIDFMPVRDGVVNLMRIVEGRRGTVAMRLELLLRFDYGATVPWVERLPGGLSAIAGPHRVELSAPVPLASEGFVTRASFDVAAGQRLPFVLTWHPSHEPPPPPVEPEGALAETTRRWRAWSARCTYRGPYHEAVLRSLITLKALTYAPTGGIVAAPTTSLPEQLGGVRNWDYRFCWLRDATLTLIALLDAGYREEARAWRAWLLRAVAGQPAATRVLYGLAGERHLAEIELPWLPGYEGSRPVRIGNAAAAQFQLDIYGEVIDALYLARRLGLEADEHGWSLERALIDFVEEHAGDPDEGIWEVRGPRRHFTHSKVMAWVALDRGVKSIEELGLDGPLARWRHARDALHDQICREGFDVTRDTFVQSYGASELDASLLLIPIVGFLPASDPRVRGTVAAIERHLVRGGFVSRYDTAAGADGLPPGEGAFLACTFWLADNYVLAGRHAEAQATFERLLGLCNDVGLLAEEYDPAARRQLGNFPQAFSHVGLINTAMNLSPDEATPATQRTGKG